MRTVYIGTSSFAVTVLEHLARSAHSPALVVTRPDAPRGRGRKLSPPPVAAAARELGLEVEQPHSVNSADARARIAAARPGAVCVCAFGALLREPLLSAHSMLNVHPSLLPRWRGAAPIERAMEAGDARTGVSIMRPTAELDAGPVCAQAVEPIDPGDDFGALSARLAGLGGELLVEALDRRPPFVEQTPEGATFAAKISNEERLLHGDLDAAALERRVRALTPHVGARVALPGGELLGVQRARVAPAGHQVPPPGKLAASDGHLLLGAQDGALELLQVKPAGGHVMDASAYLRGRGAALAEAA